ncbi:hypothetical protein NPIL_53811 [Nephila pilipes]|uniref:Uncharacterized protein n=1 Tax=Nephila pilipes TaxID=299642 RepID=A0A8X6TZQ8_NEPPI|nr:hypothetical protein NPIL_53811 [Nephila pilipes]
MCIPNCTKGKYTLTSSSGGEDIERREIESRGMGRFPSPPLIARGHHFTLTIVVRLVKHEGARVIPGQAGFKVEVCIWGERHLNHRMTVAIAPGCARKNALKLSTVEYRM